MTKPAKSEEKKISIGEIRPPNPFDFNSLCEFLEKVLKLDGVHEEYTRIISMIQVKTEESKSGANKKVNMQVFEEDAFEEAISKTFFIISSALIKFKQLSPHDQDVKREFLSGDNGGNLRNALTASGFPEAFGREVIGKMIPEANNFKVCRALIKANSVFERAFYFTLKENELTKKSIDELMGAVRIMREAEDLKKYLDTLLYKVEVASTEKSFINLKRIIAAPLVEICKSSESELETLESGNSPAGKSYSKEKMEEELQLVSDRTHLLKDYTTGYFSSPDFVYVEKNLLQFKKGKTEQVEKNSKAKLSDEFMATIDRKLNIQLISAFKACYNTKELWLLKAWIFRGMMGTKGAKDDRRFQVKKNLLLDALKRIRTDMIVEDTFNTATENKKTFIENFEKELLRLSAIQLEKEVLFKADAESDSLYRQAKRTLERKADEKDRVKEEEKKVAEQVEKLDLYFVQIILNMFTYNRARRDTAFSSYQPTLDALVKYAEGIVKKIEHSGEKAKKREQFNYLLSGFREEAKATTKLPLDQDRLFQAYLKGLNDRLQYW